MAVRRKIYTRADPRLGRHVHHDDRSWDYKLDTSGVDVADMEVKDWQRFSPILDQGQIGSCTGNAGIGALGTDPLYGPVLQFVPGLNFDEGDALNLYHDATVADPYPGTYPPDDTGSDGLTIGKVLKSRKWISEYRHTFSLIEAVKGLQLGPAITGIPWTASMFEPDTDGFLNVDFSSGVVGGHELVVDAVLPVYSDAGELDYRKSYIRLSNSWGIGWGRNGRAYLTLADWGALLDRQGDVTFFIAPTTVAPEPVDPDAALVAATRAWRKRKVPAVGAKAAQRALRDWVKAKGL